MSEHQRLSFKTKYEQVRHISAFLIPCTTYISYCERVLNALYWGVCWRQADGRCYRVLSELYTFLEINKRTFKRFKLKKVIQIGKLSKVFRIYYITKVHTSSFNLDDLVRNSKVCQGKPLRC